MIYLINSCSNLISKFNISEIVAPGAVGAIGGWATGIGPQRGFLQGVVTGGYNIVVLSKLKYFIDSKTDFTSKDSAKLSYTSNTYLRIAGLISSLVVPLIFMQKYGDFTLLKIANVLPSAVAPFVLPQGTSYSYKLGVYTNIAPGILSTLLSLTGVSK